MQLKGTARFSTIAPNGEIINDCRLENLKPYYSSVVADVVSACRARLSEELCAVYVFGSVAIGSAVEGVSDLDMAAVIKRRDGVDLSWTKRFRMEIPKKHPFITAFDFKVASCEEVLSAAKFTRFRICLQTRSLCVFGADIRNELPALYVGPHAAIHVPQIEYLIARYKYYFRKKRSSDQKRARCRSIMKAILRTGFELVMEHENAYTLDLHPCYAMFSKHYPEQKPRMRRALELALNPTADEMSSLAFLEDFSPWLLREVESFLQRHNISPRTRRRKVKWLRIISSYLAGIVGRFRENFATFRDRGFRDISDGRSP